jgi:Ca2+-dependent lipid-binding protein
MCYGVADVPVEKLQTQVLQLHVFDYDRITRDDSIGEVLLPLWQVLLINEFKVHWLHANAITTSNSMQTQS